MNSFWGSLYDWSKDRRYAALFFVTLITFLGLVIAGVVFCLRGNPRGFRLEYLLPAGCVLAAALVCFLIRFLRTQRPGSSNCSPLSRDEVSKARSKLLQGQKLKKL